MRTGIKIMLLVFCAFGFIGCDQVTKGLAKEHLMGGESVSYFHDTFRLVYVENTGAFLGLGSDLPPAVSFWVFAILPLMLLASFALYIFYKSKELAFSKLFILTMIISGGLGNVIDRILYDRHVTDFMNMGIGSFRTGIFNVADVYITFGSIVLLLFFSRTNNTSAVEIAQKP